MGKHRTSEQDAIFVAFMDRHPDLAKNFAKGDRVAHDALWNELTDELNQCGPPVKNMPEWKMAWKDWKKNIKAKLAHNKRESQSTGGGRFNQYVLTPVEEAVAKVAELHCAIEGIKGASSFGMERETPAPLPSPNSGNNSSIGSATAPDTENTNLPCVNIQGPARKRQRQTGSVDAFSPEEMRSFLKEESETFKNISATMNEVKEAVQKMSGLFTDFVEETKRHNLAMEQARGEQI